MVDRKITPYRKCRTVLSGCPVSSHSRVVAAEGDGAAVGFREGVSRKVWVRERRRDEKGHKIFEGAAAFRGNWPRQGPRFAALFTDKAFLGVREPVIWAGRNCALPGAAQDRCCGPAPRGGSAGLSPTMADYRAWPPGAADIFTESTGTLLRQLNSARFIEIRPGAAMVERGRRSRLISQRNIQGPSGLWCIQSLPNPHRVAKTWPLRCPGRQSRRTKRRG